MFVCISKGAFRTLGVLARLVWGNQETIWTLSREAATAQPSPRRVAIAKPEQDSGKHHGRSVAGQ